MSRLHDLHSDQGQSPWLDNLRRDWIQDGELAHWVERGVRGVTSNPSIFQKAISGSDLYDDEMAASLASGDDVEAAYWDLVTTDIAHALEILRPVYDESRGGDGYVSVEVAPSLARDTEGTTTAARELHARLDAPNLYVKIPGTTEGLPAIQRMIAEGRSINVTLLFSVERYAEVMEAHLSGLEEFVAAGGDPGPVSSVASFFVSRIDGEIDKRLDAVGTEEARAMKGRAAVANAQVAYQLFRDTYSGPRWEALAAAGAQLQRPLWASTSTKDPTYPETLYVDRLIGPDTVNTLPDATLAAFEDHGTVARTVDADLDGARAVLEELTTIGVDLADVTRQLEVDGVDAFAASYDGLIATLAEKAASLADADSGPGAT